MSHFETPVQKMSLMMNNELYIKRDDLIPFSFGGNKCRIAIEFFKDMKKKECNCIIGYGNARSNLCRVLSNLAYQNGIPCYIISPSDDNGKRIITSNYRLVKWCDPVIVQCDKTHVSNTVESVFKECFRKGMKPYYIYGDIYGCGNEAVPVEAYKSVYTELLKTRQSKEYDYIFLATGTGMTQAGLLAGQILLNGKESIIGISVARSAEKAENAIRNSLESYFDRKLTQDETERVKVIDKYICGEYGKYDSYVEDIIKTVYLKDGIQLDPTYTGKAFSGMMQYIKENGICGKRILFIHTGGSPLFFDYLYQKKSTICTELCNDESGIKEFLLQADKLFPIPLSERVDLEEYVRKIVSLGNVLVYKENQKIVSALLFYANDLNTKTGYITTLATLPGFEGRGIAKQLMEEMHRTAKEMGMQKMRLDTDKCNSSAILLYLKLGYQIIDCANKITMERSL